MRLKFLQDISALAGGQLVNMAVGFVTFAYLARTLDASSYGALEYSVGLAGFFMIVIDCGLGPIGARDVSRRGADVADIASRISSSRLLIACTVIPIAGLSSWMTGQEPRVVTLAWLYSLALVAVPFNQEWLFQGLEITSRVVVARLLRVALFALGALILIRGADDLLRAGFLEIAAALGTSAYYLLNQHQRNIPIRLCLSWRRLWPMIRAGSAVGASNMVWAFMLYAPVLLLGSLSDPEELAWFGATQRIAVSLLTFSFLYYFRLFPILVKQMAATQEEWERLMHTSHRFLAWTSIGIALPITALAGPLITLVFGEDFTPAEPVLAVLIWLLPLRFLSGHARWALIAGGRQNFLLISEVVGAAVLLATGLALVPRVGAMGAAVAVLAGVTASWAASRTFAAEHIISLPGHVHALFPGFVALAGLAAAHALTEQPFLVAVTALTCYATAALAMGRRLFDDLRYLSRMRSDANPAD